VHGGATSWIVDVSEGYEAYARARREGGGPGLKPLDKKRRKAECELGPVVFTPRSASAVDFAQLFAWKRAQLRATGQIDIFAPAWPLRLMQSLFTGGAAPLTGLLFTLHVGGRLAAAHFHLAGRRTLHAWMIAHCASVERYSPGLLLFQDILKWMDETAFERLDLGLGDYRFKRELANTHQTVAHGFVGVPSPAAFLRSAAYGVRAAAERLPLGAASAVPGKAMRRLDVLRALN
jgi:CelD/BcsL family acetyltransferase involved in cellulose biosynthesis